MALLPPQTTNTPGLQLQLLFPKPTVLHPCDYVHNHIIMSKLMSLSLLIFLCSQGRSVNLEEGSQVDNSQMFGGLASIAS